MAKRQILIVDDEVTLMQLLKFNLEQAGPYEVRVEGRGRWAVATAREFKPELIFLDVIMPDIDGSQVAAEIQADPQLQPIPIVFLTAIVSQRETTAHGGLIGGCAFLAKPVSTQDLLACIERYLGTTQSADASTS